MKFSIRKIIITSLLFILILVFNNDTFAQNTESATTSIDSNTIDMLWVTVAAILVFIMQAGFKALEVGLVRKNHVITVSMKNLIDWVISSIFFFLIGFGIMYGESIGGLFGLSLFVPDSFSTENGSQLGATFFIFQLAFVGTAVTIVSGAMSERTGFIPYLVGSVLIITLIYPVFGHWAWGGVFLGGENQGWLESLGFIDFAGSTVVHGIGGWVSLIGIYLVGPRIGRYNKEGKPNNWKPNNLPYAVLGVILLWIGWWGFNGGSTLSFNENIGMIIITTNISGAVAGLTAYLHSYFFQKKADIFEKLIGGVLGGLVAITASANIISPLSAMAIGFGAGIIHNYTYDLIIKRLKLDDTVGAVPVHGFCGAFGTIILALLVDESSLPNGRWHQLGIQALGVLVCFVWATGVGYIAFSVLRKVVGLRVSPEEERQGFSLFPLKEEEKDNSASDEDDDEELRKLLEQMQ